MSQSANQIVRRPARPWGRAVGLLAACAITLSGIVRDLSPDVILERAALGGVVLGVVTAAAALFFRSLNERSPQQ